MGNNLFSLGGLNGYLPSASPRAITIKPPLLHRLFPNKSLPDYDYFYIILHFLTHEIYKVNIIVDWYFAGIEWEIIYEEEVF